jgi:cytidine deaminase
MTDDLIAAANKVRAMAYAPYSGFQVGAAIRSTSGAVHVGCNVENVAYPEGTCAEAGAIAAMIAAGDTEIAEVAVIADGTDPVPPVAAAARSWRNSARATCRSPWRQWTARR